MAAKKKPSKAKQIELTKDLEPKAAGAKGGGVIAPQKNQIISPRDPQSGLPTGQRTSLTHDLVFEDWAN